MMKSFLFLPLLLLTVIFSSCKKEYITQEVVNPNRTFYTTIKVADWQRSNDTESWYAKLALPADAADAVIHDSGAVLPYISFDGGKTYETVPDVFYGTTFQITHDATGVYMDTQGADGFQVDPPTVDIFVKVVLIDSVPQN